VAVYKGVEIDRALFGLIRHMQGVDDYREVLGRLQAAWDTLTLLGQLTGTAAEMSGTREAFEKLTGDLLNHLGQETRRKAAADLRAKAQNGIDILVRNLFERTADIGFLSGDAEVIEFLDSGAPEEGRGEIVARFREYVAKYSVYSDIVLLDAEGRVQARLLDHQAEVSSADFHREALSTRAGYVEWFGSDPLLPPGRHLVYAYRVEAKNQRTVGTLVLVFRLSDEMDGIFGKLVNDSDWTVLACANAQGQIIASSSPLQFPLDAQLPRSVLDASGEVIRFGGRQYVAVGCKATGYQGYMGPGWFGLAFIPVEVAFDSEDARLLADVDQRVMEGLMQASSLFSDGLRAIPRKAAMIQQDLNRSVWNGSVRQAESLEYNAAFSKTLLWEISSAGRKTQEVFEQSIGNLHETVVAAVLQNVLSRAALAIDVMDRNLYERANDCRWWALTTAFQRHLSRGMKPDGRRHCADLLRSINALYTVYSGLMLFDALGKVVAVSRPEHDELVDTHLNEDWVARALMLRGTQNYAASTFEPSPTYGNRPTYVFAAPIREPEGTRALGGIAIVFDSEPQFAAMLADSLPRDDAGTVLPGSFALFLRRNGEVMCSSDLSLFAPGSSFGNEQLFATLEAGGSACRIVAVAGRWYAVGCVMSAGYREYKVTDGHVDDVVALCAVPLGEVSAASMAPARRETRATRIRRADGGQPTIELATFHVGSHWFGVPARDVVEAVDVADMTPTPTAGNGALAGYKLHRNALVPVVRLDRLMAIAAETPDPQQAIILRLGPDLCVGVLVDALGEVPEIPCSDVLPLQDMLVNRDILASGVVASLERSDGANGMLTMIDLERLAARITCERHEPARKIAS
jgi:chemotaxis signal transduction protein